MTGGGSERGPPGSGNPPVGLDLTETYVFLGRQGRAERVPLTEALWDEVAEVARETEQDHGRAPDRADAGAGTIADTGAEIGSDATAKAETKAAAKLETKAEVETGSKAEAKTGAVTETGTRETSPASRGEGREGERERGGAGRAGLDQDDAERAAAPQAGADRAAARLGGPEAPPMAEAVPSDTEQYRTPALRTFPAVPSGSGPDPQTAGSLMGAVRHGMPLHGEGWLVSAYWLEADMTTWERHPTGDRLIVAQSGAFTLVLDRQNGPWERVPLNAGGAVFVPRGSWHRLIVNAAGLVMLVTPSHGMEHRLAT